MYHLIFVTPERRFLVDKEGTTPSRGDLVVLGGNEYKVVKLRYLYHKEGYANYRINKIEIILEKA